MRDSIGQPFTNWVRRGLVAVVVVSLLLGLVPLPPLRAQSGDTGAISGIVYAADGVTPLSGARVWASRDDGGEGGGEAITDDSGQYTITDLPPGQYKVGAEKDGYIEELYQDTNDWNAATLVEVNAGQTTTGINFTLEDAYIIGGHVYYEGSPVAGVEVSTGCEGWGTGFTTEASGVYTLTVPAGTWQLHVQGGGYVHWGEIVVTVPPSRTDVDIEVEQAYTISGRTLYDGSPVSDIDVNTGDETWGTGTRSDASGVYTLTVPAGTWQLHAWGHGYVLTEGPEVTVPPSQSGVDLNLERGGVISGTVRRAEDGAPLGNVPVGVHNLDMDYGQGTMTRDDGTYIFDSLPYGTYIVFAGGSPTSYMRQFYDHKSSWEEADPLTVSSTPLTDIDFFLQMGATISGTVKDPEGNPVNNAWAFIHDAEHRFNEGVNSDELGHFAIGGVPTGTYILEVNPPPDSPWAPSEEYPVNVPSLGETVDVGTVLLTRPVLTGVVTAPDGETPIPGAWVEVHTEDWTIQRGDDTDQNGVFRIGGLPDGVYTLEARAPDWGEGAHYSDSIPRAVTVVAGETTYVGIVPLTEPQIFGRVTLPDGVTPVPHAWVEARSMDWMVSKGTDTDDEGRFAIGGLITGTYFLRAHPPGGGAYADYAASEEMEVVLSGEPITLTEPLRLQGVNVRGRVVDPDGNPVCCTGVDVYTADHMVHQSTGTNDEGRFAFGGLPVGDYLVEIHVPWGVSDWVSPEPRPFSITSTTSIVDLGDLAFLRASKHVQGVVVRAEDGSGVPNAEVNANRRDGMGWAHTETDDEGRFSLGLSGGSWELMIHPRGDDADWVYAGHPIKVTFADDDTPETKVVTFTVRTADAHVIGAVRGPNGELLKPWSVWVDVRDDKGMGNGRSLAEDGTFDIPVVAGTYNVWIHADEWEYPTWGSPKIDPITVESGETYDLGTLYLVVKNSFITGRVTRESDGQGVAGVNVDAWQPAGAGWAHTTTTADGSYSLAVTPGEWEIGIHVPFTSTYVSGQPPQMVSVGEEETVSGVDFVLQEADGTIEGVVVDEEGNVLTDVYGWAYARQGNAPPLAGGPLENGHFTIHVPAGSYRVGVGLPPDSNYTPAGEVDVDISKLGAMVAALSTRQDVAATYRARAEQQVIVPAGGTQQVSITLLPNNARIVGQFFLDMEKTIPATGLQGEVFAIGGMGGAWRGTPINPQDGTYELNVAAGTWNLGYWLMNDEYVNNPPPESRVTIEAGETFTMNFTLVVADSIIQGHLLKPDGSPLNHAFAWAHRERTETSARIDTGDEGKPPDAYFEIHVPAGEYKVGGYAPEELGYIQPEVQQVTVSPTSTVSVTLQFRASNGVISGTVFYHDEAGNKVYGPWAWVWAWSESGAHTGTMTDDQGHYRLNVVTGTVWHLGATYQYDDSVFYETVQDYVVDMTGPTATQDMELFLNETKLPDALTVYFDASSPVLIVLDDGTEINIPAGALAVTGTVKVVVTPMVEELPNTLTARPFGYGYAIYAFDSSGRQITSNFNQNVNITFYYTDEELRKRGVSEDDLSPAYFSTTTNSWTKVESFTVDKVNNRVTAQINHFSVWAMTAPAGERSTYQVFLPLVLKW